MGIVELMQWEEKEHKKRMIVMNANTYMKRDGRKKI